MIEMFSAERALTPDDLSALTSPIQLEAAERFCGKNAEIVHVFAGTQVAVRSSNSSIEFMVLQGRCEIERPGRTLVPQQHQPCHFPAQCAFLVKAMTNLRAVVITGPVP